MSSTQAARLGAPPDPRAPFITGREALIAAIVWAVLISAFRFFDEWRGPIQWLARLAFTGFPAFFIGRAYWRWWRRRTPGASTVAIWIALSFAVVGWADLAVAKAVVNMSDGNYALIIIAPLMMLVGAMVSLGGLAATGIATAAVVTAVTRPIPRAGFVASGGIAAIVLNLAPIALLLRAFEGR